MSATLKKLKWVVDQNQSMNDACQRLCAHIVQHPEIEADMDKVFGVMPPPEPKTN